jgi:GNAT superfamily N-acetyltransferase
MNVTPIFKRVDPNHPQLKEVITASIGNPTADKINTVLASYAKDGKLIGAFISDQLVGCVGYSVNAGHLVIRHLSVAEDFQNKKIATNLMHYILAFEDCHELSASTDIEAKDFYEKLLFQCIKTDSKFDTDRFECVYLKKQIKITEKTLENLGTLSAKINERYGYVSHAGDNFGEPVINSGPCGPFANEFYKAWNARFKNRVKIAFVMQNEPRECYHVVIILPDDSFYDGGVGLHLEKKYLEKGLDIVVMGEYNYQLLDKHSYGLDRGYPRYCPDFDLQELTEIINRTLDDLYLSIN